MNIERKRAQMIITKLAAPVASKDDGRSLWPVSLSLRVECDTEEDARRLGETLTKAVGFILTRHFEEGQRT